MKIPLSPSPPSGDTLKAATTTVERGTIGTLGLPEGQATLARVLEQRPTEGPTKARLMLEVSGQTVAVDSDIELQPGTLIRLQRAGNTLRLLEKLAGPSTNVLSAALAQKLPAQFDLQAGFKIIANLGRALSNERPPLSPTAHTAGAHSGNSQAAGAGTEAATIRSALSQVLALMPQQGQLTGGTTAAPEGQRSAQMQTWIQNSGLFTEAQLASGKFSSSEQGAPTTPTDLKSQLLRLAVQLLKTDVVTASSDLHRLRPAVSPELVQQALQFPLAPVSSNSGGQSVSQEAVNAGVLLRVLAGMINRITVNQLHSQALSTAATADGAAPPQTWLLELPWLNPQQEPKVVQVRIERHGGEPEGEPEESTRKHLAQWRLSLALDLEDLGPVYFELALTRKSLSAKLWAELEPTVHLMEDYAEDLRSNLGALGLEIKSLECRQGQPPQARTRLNHRLVDEKA